MLLGWNPCFRYVSTVCGHGCFAAFDLSGPTGRKRHYLLTNITYIMHNCEIVFLKKNLIPSSFCFHCNLHGISDILPNIIIWFMSDNDISQMPKIIQFISNNGICKCHKDIRFDQAMAFANDKTHANLNFILSCYMNYLLHHNVL